MPEKNLPLDANSSAVHKHLDIMQGVIDRMAAESRMLKTWCITIVAAILVLVARGDLQPSAVLIAFLPTVAFCLLDWWYLKMERGFRNAYNGFVTKLHDGKLSANDLYVVKPEWTSARVPFPYSVVGFYSVVAVSIILVLVLVYFFPPMTDAAHPCPASG